MSVIQKDQNGVDHEILTLKEWEAKQGTTAQSAADFGGYLGYSTGALVEAGQDPDEAYRTVSQNLFGTAVKRGFVQAPAQDDPEAEAKLNESFRTFSDQVTKNPLQDYGVLASSLRDTDPDASAAFQSYYDQANEAKKTGQLVVQTPDQEATFNTYKTKYGTPDQIRDARIRAAKEKGLSYVEYTANDKGDRSVWINPDPTVAKDANSILDSYKRSDGLNSPVTLKFAQTQVQKTPGRDTAPYEDNDQATLQQWLIGSNERVGSQNPESANAAQQVQDALNSAKEIQQEAYGQGATSEEALRREVTVKKPSEYESIGGRNILVSPAKVINTGKIAEAKLNGLYDSLKQAYPTNEIFSQYTKQQFVNAAGDLVKQSLQVPVNNEDPTKNFVKLSNGTYAPLASTALLPKEKFAEAMDKLGLDDRAKAAAEIIRKGYLAGEVDTVTQAFEDFDGDKFSNYRIEWLAKQDPTKKPSQTQLIEDYMSEVSNRKDWNVLAAKASGVLASVGKSFNPIVQAIGGGVSNAIGFENGKNFFLDWAVGDAEIEASRSKYANLYGSDLGTGYQFLSQAAPMIADIAISGGVSGLAKGFGRAALKETLVAGAEAGATASMRNLIPTSVKDFAGNVGKNWIAKALSPETRALFGQSYVRNFADVGAAAVKADSALVNKVFRGIKDDLANRVIPQAAGVAAQRASSFARSAESQYVDTTIAMRSEFNPDGSRKFTDEEIHKSALTHSLVAGTITALVEQASGKVFGEGADAVNYGNVNLRQLKYYTNRVTSSLERSSLGGEEVLGAIKSVVREAAKESGYGILKEGVGEFSEEFVDQLGQSVANAMLDNKDLNLTDALKDAFQAGVIGFAYGTAVPALGNARKVNEIRDRQQGVAQSVEGEFLSNIIGKLEADGQSPETVAALKNRLQIANRNFQPVSERIPVRPASADLVTALDEAPEQPLNIGQKPTMLTPSGSVPTALASKKAAELGVSQEELNSIQGSGKANKKGNATITPNDVQAYVAQRANRVAAESDIDWNDQAQVEAYLTRNGVKFVSEGNESTPTVDETRTFKDLNGQLVIINGTRGRIRVEADGVLLDPETNEPPIEVTPNADMPATEFEGFEGAVAEPSLVSPRRGVRRVALTVSDAGEIVYGKTRYSAPTTPSLVNVKVADNGDIDSMYVLVQNKNGKAVYAYVTGENAQKLRQVYEGRGQESADAFANAVANSKAVDVQRNQAAASAKQKQSNQRRKNKRAKNGAPVVSNQGQAAVESEANYALSRITDNTVNPKLVEELKSIAVQLGLDPESFTTTEELFRIVGPELAAGLDLAAFTQEQVDKAIENVQQGRTNTLLDFLVQQEAISPLERAVQANRFAKLRAQHRVQFTKHGIKEGAMDVKAVLQSIIRSGKSKQHRETAKFLLSVGVDQCPVFVYNAPNDVATTGSYLGSSKIIALNAASDNGGGIVDALLHELGHFGTSEILTNPKTEFEREVRTRLLALRAETQARIEAKYGTAIPENLRYAVEGRMSENESFDETYAVNEFVAHYFASQTFRNQLDELNSKGERSLFQKFVDIIGSWFSGKRLADPESRALAEAMLDLKKAVAESNGLPARSIQQILASRAAVAREDGFGPMYGVPNPHPRTSFKWINHQTDSLQDGIFSEDQLRALIKTGKFGAFTAENPDVTVQTEEANAAFNERAKQWLADRGYVADLVVGRYGNGENSFLVEGFTDQDAVDFANEFGQESMATDTGLFYQDGMYQPRDGEELDIPADEASDDNYFTNVRTTEGKIITVRVMYADYKLDSGLRPSKDVVTATGSESQIVQQVQNQKEFATVLSKDTAKPFVLDGNTLLVNEGLVNEVYGNYGFDEQTSLVERDLAVAVAHELAIQKVGYDTHVAFEDAGLNAAQVIERAAGNDLTASDLQDLLALGDQAKDYVAAAFAEIGKRNTGENERLAVAQNRLGDLYRYLQRNGEDVPQEAENFSDTLSDTDVAIAERLRPVEPTKFFSKAYSGFNAADLKPGQALGTRNPTGKRATESGLDPMSLISLDVMARDPKAYRTNALYLTEYPIVARKFPELAAMVRKLRTKHEKTSGEIRVNADQIKRYKKVLKDLLTVDKVKATDAQFEDALLLENGGLTGQAGKDFAKNQAALEKCLAKSTKLKALGTEQKSAMTKKLAEFASDPNHPIAKLAPQIYDVVIQNTQSNLEALINLFPKSLRNVAKLWYDGANKIANEFGAQYAQDVEQASGVLAVFSPQKDWFMNITLAERTMKIWHEQVILGNPNGLVWSPAMTAQWLKRGGEPQITTEATDGTKPIYEKGKVKAVYDNNGEHVLDEQGNPMFTGWSNANAEAGRAKAREVLKNVEGRALKDLAIEDQARFIRMYSEVNDSPSFMKYAPDGTNTQEASRSETSGKEIKIGWGSYSTVQKAIRIMSSDKNTKLKVVSAELGNMHKVRSFYNNIVDPNNEDGHVTMDTHAVAALYWQALSANSLEVMQNFGSSNVTNNSILGVNGMYAANAEAYRAAAQTFGLLPREIQSITWEAVRLLFPAKWKSNKKNVDAIRAVWAQYEQDKNFTIEDVRAAVFKLATGKDINEAYANTEDLAMSLGFPSWAQVELRKGEAGEVPLEQAAPTVQKSRATTKEDIFNQLSVPKVSVNPPNGQPLYVTGYHGGTFDGRTPMKASSEGVYGYGYYTTPDVTRAKDYAVAARKEMGQAEVTTFDLLLKKPLVVKVSNKARGPALVFEALGLSGEKAEAKAEHLFEQYGNIGKHFKSLGEKQGYDGLVILNADGTIAESVAWTRDSLAVDDNAPTIQFSRAALAPTTEQESKAFASATKNKRSGELAVAAVRLAEGQIDNATFADLVEVLDPWVVKGARAIPPIEQVKQYIVSRRDGKILSADEEEKVGKVMEDLDIPEGQVIDWRIDIPTYKESLKYGEVTYAITAHPLNNVGKTIGYTNIARVRNGRVMTRVEKGNPMTIAQGGGKFPLATVQGENVKIDRLPSDINDPTVWAEIAYNPARSSEFVDVRTKLPVLTFSDAIMVGSRVFMKNPTYDSKPRYQQPRVNLAGELTGEIDMRYSRASVQADTDYLAAVNAGDTSTAQNMVNSAAVNSGYSEQTYYRGQRKFLDRLVKPTRNQKPSAVGDFINKFFPSKASRGMAWLTDSKYLANQYAVMGDYKLSAMPSSLAQRPKLITEGQYGLYSGGGVLQSAKLDLSNSLQVDANGSMWNEIQFEGKKLTSDQIADIAKAKGFDSVVIANVKDGFTGMAMNETATVVAVFEDTKIKSADAVTYDNNGEAVPISQRFNQTVSSIRYSKSAAPALFRGKEVQLTHWSFDSDLKTTDPTMHGTGGIGAEKDRKRDYKKIYQPRTYFGYSSYVREYIIGPFRYQIKVAGDSLYDYEADPLDLYPSRDERVAAGYARFDDRAANTMYEKAIKDHGFAGFVCKSHTAGVLFGKHKVTKVPDSDRSLALSPKPKAPKPLLSRAVTAVTSPDIEAAYRVSLDDLAINEVTGEYNFGTKLTRLFRASGNLDPRMFEAKQYQERAMALANARVAGLTKTFLHALKKDSNVDLDDVNVALGTTAPTVSASDRDAARATRDAAIEAANVQFQQTDKAYATYKKATAQARADYLVHQDVKRYQAEVTTLQADLANSSEKQTRNAAITAAHAAYDLEIQAGRARGVKAAMTAQQQALFRLEQTSPRVAEVVTEFRAAIDSLSQQLVESLGPNDPMRAVVTENLGVYLTRSYQIHHDEGYVQKIKEDPTFAQARQEARDFFEKAWVKRTFKTWRSNDLYAVFSDAEVQALVEAEAKAKSVGSIELDNFIEQHGNTPEIPGKITNKTDLSRFMEKGEVPRELVAILGEVQNPVENAVRTYSNLAKFVGAQRLLNEFTSVGVANGFLITADEKAKDPEKYRLYEPLLNSTKTLGGEPLSNFYAPPEVKEAFQLSFTPDFKAKQGDAVELIKKVDEALAAVVGKSLGMITLGSAGFYTRNLLGNVAFMIGNGFVASPANIADAFKGLNEIYGTNFWNQALQVMPTALRPDEKFSLSELGPLGSDLIALGIKDSMNAGVLRELLAGMRDDPENFVAKLEQTIRSKGKLVSAAVTAVTAPVKAVNTVFDSLAGAAEAIDLVYKFAYYSHEVGIYTKANAHNTTKWTDNQIKQLAARTVRKTTQGNSENPALVKAFQKSKLLSTLFNSFFRFTTEAARIVYATGQLSFQEMNSGNPVLKTRGRLRLGGLMTSLALSTIPELVKLAGGYDDEKEQAIRNGLPAWAQNVNYYFTKDSKDPNKVKMWNLTYVLPFSIIMDPVVRSLHLIANKRGSEAPMVAIKAVAEAFLSPQIAVQAFAKVLNNVDDRGGKIYYENDSTATAALKIGKFLASTAYRLKTPQKFYEAFEAYTNGSVYDKDARLATAAELVANEFSPFQTRRYDLTKLAHQAFAKAKRNLDDVSQERGKFLSYSTLGKQDIENTYRTLQDARVYAAQKLKNTMAGYESLGVPMQELKKQATDAGFSRDRVNQILNRNAVDRVVFPPDLFKDMLERGGEANGQARVDFLKQVIRDTPRNIPLNP